MFPKKRSLYIFRKWITTRPSTDFSPFSRHLYSGIQWNREKTDVNFVNSVVSLCLIENRQSRLHALRLTSESIFQSRLKRLSSEIFSCFADPLPWGFIHPNRTSSFKINASILARQVILPDISWIKTTIMWFPSLLVIRLKSRTDVFNCLVQLRIEQWTTAKCRVWLCSLPFRLSTSAQRLKCVLGREVLHVNRLASSAPHSPVRYLRFRFAWPSASDVSCAHLQ